MLDRIKENELLDFYGSLLTEKQNRICGFYYRDDLSLMEIAEQEGISRSAVHDLIRRTKKELDHYETCLGMVECYRKRMQYYQKILAKGDPEINQLVEKCIETEGGYYE